MVFQEMSKKKWLQEQKGDARVKQEVIEGRNGRGHGGELGRLFTLSSDSKLFA